MTEFENIYPIILNDQTGYDKLIFHASSLLPDNNLRLDRI